MLSLLAFVLTENTNITNVCLHLQKIQIRLKFVRK